MSSHTNSLEVGVLLTGGAVQFLDIAPVDVLATLTPEYLAALSPMGVPESITSQNVPMNVHWISETGEAGQAHATTANGRVVVTDTLKTSSPLHILLIPGPPPDYRPSPEILSFITATQASGSCIAVLSICTGILPLAATGLLNGKKATGPRGMLPFLRSQFPSVEWTEERYAHQDRLWTSGGVANGLDMISAFMRQQFADKRDTVEFILGLADVGDRGQKYSRDSTF